MSALPRLGWFGWLLAAVAALFIATLHVDAAASPLVLGLVAGAFVFLVHLPGFRSRPWLRALGAPLLAGGLGFGLAYGASRAPWGDVRAFLGDNPPLWFLGLVVLVPLLVRLLVPPAAGRRVLRLLGIEWRKLWKGRLLWFGLLACIAVPLVVGFTYEPGESDTGWAAAAVLLKAGAWMAEILLLVLGAVAIAGEIGQGTMKMILPHAYKRSDWILAKGILLTLVAVGFALAIGATSAIYAGVQYGLGDVVQPGEPAFNMPDTLLKSSDVMTQYLQDTVLASMASAIAIVWIALLLSSLFSSVVPALSTAFLLFVALRFGNVLLVYSTELRDMLFTSYPEAMIQATEEFGKRNNSLWEPARLAKCLWLSGLTVVLSALAAVVAFDRRELG